MKKTLTIIEEGNMPTTVQMKLLHWLTQLELSEGAADGSVIWPGCLLKAAGRPIIQT